MKQRTILLAKLKTFLFSFIFMGQLTAQTTQPVTVVEGYVVDSLKGDTIPFANISLLGTSEGISADENGYFKFSFDEAKNVLQISAVGFATHFETIKIGTSQRVKIQLVSTTTELQTVVIKKERYRNRNNPAVELIQKVIAHKSTNRLENHDFYEYKQYQKLELDLANVGEGFKNSKYLSNVKFFFEDTDTSKVSGKNLTPIYQNEKLSNVYYRKSPETHKEYIEGSKSVDLGNLFDETGLDEYLQYLYIKTDIYNNEILLFKKPFLSPLSPISPDFYRFYIMDTTDIGGKRCINLAFFPRSKADLNFEGNLYITDDSTYAVRKVNMTAPKDININFLHELRISQQFAQLPDSSWSLVRDEVMIDFGITNNKKSLGLWGKKTTMMSDFVFNKPQKAEAYASDQIVIQAKNADEQSADFWEKNRQEPLSITEQNIYRKADRLMQTADYQNFMGFKYLWATGYWKTHKVELGPLGALVSSNDLEGTRMRVGFRTTYEMSHHWRLEGYGAYGLLDQKWKYNGALSYQFNDDKFNNRPQSVIKAWYYNDVEIPGQNIEKMAQDNVLLSFRRGKFNKMYYKQSIGIRYTNENMVGFTYQFGLQQRQLTPAGSLSFQRTSENGTNHTGVPKLQTNEAFINLRYAPNEEFFQGQTYRRRIVNKYPVFTMQYVYGESGKTARHPFDYHKISASVVKRFFMAPTGHTDAMLEAGRTFGKGLPYPLLHVFNANQTLNYEEFAFNQMNYLEFISDKHVTLVVEHAFDGFILNKIPLIKKLKLREFATFKAAYGGLDKANDPSQNPSVYRFSTDAKRQKLTYNFIDGTPYMEAGFGISNIFKILRIDAVRRLNYLDHPNVSKWRIQGQFLFDF